MNTGQTVLDGPLVLATCIAVAAGLVSFLSPCILPLVPGYLGYVTGLTGKNLEDQRRGVMVAGMFLFVAGFSAVYVLMGWALGGLGGVLLENQTWLQRVLGVVTILLGVVYLDVLPISLPARQIAFRPAVGLAGAPVLGVVLGLGWTACNGPTLAVIGSMSALDGNPGRGAFLAFAYCLGLGIPFILAGLAYQRVMRVSRALRVRGRLIQRIGGVILIVLGVLLVTGLWSGLMVDLQTLLADFEVPQI